MKNLACLLLFIASHTMAVTPQEDHAILAADVLQSDGLIALTIKHEEKWHTYWKNPGDAGIVTTFKFEHNGKEITLDPLEWPSPHRYLEAGDILTYGYEGDPTFFFKSPDLIGEIKAKAQWLICKDICIPGGKDATVQLKSGLPSAGVPASGLSQEELKKRLDAIPKLAAWPMELDIYLSQEVDKSLRLDYSYKGYPVDKIDKTKNFLTPFLSPPFGFKRETLKFDATDNALVGKFTLDWDGEYQEPEYPLPKDGFFKAPLKMRFLYQKGNGEVAIIEKEITSFSTTAAGIEDHFQKQGDIDGATPVLAKAQEAPGAPVPTSSVVILLLAFLGGVILNLMPCVLPVISIKLFGLIKYQAMPKSHVLRHNIAYSIGVLTTFMVMATIVAVIKSSGEAIGWGFQLQSPLFVLMMVGVLFVMALNLFGLFEFNTPGAKHLGSVNIEPGFVGDFFSGVLSTILSTPCSAPFLGTALGFAFTGPTYMVFLTFASVGLGLAFPFLISGFFPALIGFLPKPGPWMQKLKYILGLTLLISTVWLSDVFLNLVDPAIWFWPLALFFITLFFAFFFREKISKNAGLNALMFLLPVALVLGAIKNFPLRPADRANMIEKGNVMWETWSPEMLQNHKGEWVFFEFTAKWCLTCKVNKKLVLDTQEFENLVKEKNLTLLRGDWTQRDDTITRFLRSYSIVGVPAYFIQKPDGTIMSIGETISISKIRSFLP